MVTGCPENACVGAVAEATGASEERISTVTGAERGGVDSGQGTAGDEGALLTPLPGAVGVAAALGLGLGEGSASENGSAVASPLSNCVSGSSDHSSTEWNSGALSMGRTDQLGFTTSPPARCNPA